MLSQFIQRTVEGFGFDLEVNRSKSSRKRKHSPTNGARSSKSEVFAYFIDRKGNERRLMDENKTGNFTSEWNAVAIREAERKKSGTFPPKLYDALRAVPHRFSLSSLHLRYVILDSSLLHFLIGLDPSTIINFGFSRSSLGMELSREECARALQWLNGLHALEFGRNSAVSMKKLLQEAIDKAR
ncbi:hypothetical protein PMAYCL1PPCAC_19008 [Pristionchus mayeri]|uniref:Uncharacterized protein n=1 Tax=Pristionchus mayeri TaxID=1317129 RepID=A0AAN5CQI8_9BILA|nr:hypothetical protein PMAYCL1PPCAC_19008 [Pristionchus mayeri]